MEAVNGAKREFRVDKGLGEQETISVDIPPGMLSPNAQPGALVRTQQTPLTLRCCLQVGAQWLKSRCGDLACPCTCRSV